jgi:ABC-type Na+ transport system ATPase subunit NatA
VTVLRLVAASFHSEAGDAVGPLDLTLAAGEHRALPFATGRAASIAARLCAAIVKPTCGNAYVGDYDTRLQPPQAKRLVGFVDVAGVAGSRYGFACEVAFRAEVWGIDVATARTRARETLRAIGGVQDPYARALALALVPDVRLVVFDQPAHPRFRALLAEMHPQIAVLETLVVTSAGPVVTTPELAAARA